IGSTNDIRQFPLRFKDGEEAEDRSDDLAIDQDLLVLYGKPFQVRRREELNIVPLVTKPFRQPADFDMVARAPVIGDDKEQLTLSGEMLPHLVPPLLVDPVDEVVEV